MEPFKVIVVEDVPLELRGTLGILKTDIPEAEIIGTADDENAYWRLMMQELPQLVLLDLGLGGSTTVGVDICRQTKEAHPDIKVLIFTGEILNEKLWVVGSGDGHTDVNHQQNGQHTANYSFFSHLFLREMRLGGLELAGCVCGIRRRAGRGIGLFGEGSGYFGCFHADTAGSGG